MVLWRCGLGLGMKDTCGEVSGLQTSSARRGTGMSASSCSRQFVLFWQGLPLVTSPGLRSALSWGGRDLFPT